MVRAGGVRIGWADIPAPVRLDIEAIIGGGPVVAAASQPGGFSPGTADRVRTVDGARAFVKAVTPALNEQSAVLARNELRITAALPEHAAAPRLLGGFDTGDWVVLVLEDVEGTHPGTPWAAHEIRAAAATLRGLAEALTPVPVAGLPTASEKYGAEFSRWDALAADRPDDLDAWAAAHLDELRAAADRGVAALAGGGTLAHTDLRADNILIRADGSLVLVDWPHACAGPAWLDSVLLAINVIVHGGDPAPLLDGVDADVVTGVMAGAAALFQHRCRQPPPPGLPTVRAFQRFQGDALLPWLRTALGEPKRG
ncbi:aminoglycoside phosphotransferase family protein [Actinoplanes sp. G11-F43]|uniref:aminoglycoside phosphotransferase family protein n=1 Tax=Actinoplanes sp. G11-F43 TaxID=3424130 RepID=UPI003D33602F